MLLTHAIFPLFFPVLHFPIQWKSRLDSDFISTDYSFHLEIPLLRHFCDAADWNRPSGKFEFKKIINIKKEFIWISSDEMDDTGADYTEWSKPERKTPIQYTDTYIWNSLAFSMIHQMLAIWSLIPLPFLNPIIHLKVLNSGTTTKV